MSLAWRSSVLERTVEMLGPRYIISDIREDDHGGYVAFNDPNMYRAEWSGPIFGGVVRYSKAELLKLEGDPGAGSKIRERVERAKDILLKQITDYVRKEGVILSRLAVSLSVLLVCWYPLVGFISLG